ncbi:MAG: matrixin family metalloprotease [Nitrosopumilus sp.]|nr:matrixin family metalloprotease [Nitrosopumilus sp.]MBL7014824.1 matrixin family metalloprotease [Nitrosopumilus sp.]MBL7017420.1 matrixin family metalloprotease [Nitrosopumilus sp.]
MKFIYLLFVILFSSTLFIQNAIAQDNQDPESMFNLAKEHFVKGEYNEAITIYDDILDIVPNNISTLKMKGIAQSNLDQHANSLKQFFKVLQHRPNDVISLTGMGVGFGNLGEYQESIAYFEKASKEKPNSVVINNYKEFINKVISKYPYTPTQKPNETKQITSIPEWIKNNAKWWSLTQISDQDFAKGIEYLVQRGIIQIPENQSSEGTSESELPSWLRKNAGWWSQGLLADDEFFKSIQWLINNGFITVNFEKDSQKSQEDLDHEFYLFEKYLRDVSNNISKEKRYIEYPNPSQDVIKKFLRDYIKWNFENEVKTASDKFPDPTYQIENDVYVVYYKVFINEQPSGLPLDHISTLKNSFEFWEGRELEIENLDKEARVKFEVTNLKHEANVWITWVVRNIGDGVLGHAHLGKGVVEVTLGDYNCDGSFQLYDIRSVETIMTHELGHSLGGKHVTDENNIMYPSFNPSYAYCLLS